MACVLSSPATSDLLQRQATEANLSKGCCRQYPWIQDNVSHLGHSPSGTPDTSDLFDAFRDSVDNAHPGSPLTSAKSNKRIHHFPRRTKNSLSNKRVQEDGESSDDDTKSPARNKDFSGISSTFEKRAFACPYYKRDYVQTSRWHSESRSHDTAECFECRFTDLARLKYTSL